MSAFNRAIDVEIDRVSWRAQPTEFRHPLPRPLAAQAGPFAIHLLEMLLRIGDLTTPVLNIQSGVARLWPLLRYLHAIADTPHLRFRQGWRDVDPHQKAIASDDLGVGLGMSVLYNAFGYAGCIDGRAFLHRMHNLGLLAFPGGLPPKVGSMKMADFAAVDQRGKFHIIEVKGTQSSRAALAKAMLDGQYQKRSLVCATPAGERRLIGQRIVVGTALTLESNARGAEVIVMDPAPDEDEAVSLASRVSQQELREPAIRMQVSRLLGAAGAFRTSVAISEVDEPLGAPALEGPGQRDRVQAAIRDDDARLTSFQASGETWRGEEIVAPLLAPLLAGDRIYRRARVRQGISEMLFRDLQEGGGRTAFFQDAYPSVAQRLSAPKVDSGEAYAVLVRPSISLSSVELLEA
ncbi:MAG: hypothetical protein JNK30_06790 [Phenylobacterium sp.]|uniref:hypothetical protein n=1 Tax=Phenylobacterium sp. TaxID=1871053 RepID=UPI001A5453AF|nr:hypothetical protein [Phenylobacterium sp.]MBL8771074.1 hypothetical protein [Phenylobacterium sp.]